MRDYSFAAGAANKLRARCIFIPYTIEPARFTCCRASTPLRHWPVSWKQWVPCNWKSFSSIPACPVMLYRSALRARSLAKVESHETNYYSSFRGFLFNFIHPPVSDRSRGDFSPAQFPSPVPDHANTFPTATAAILFSGSSESVIPYRHDAAASRDVTLYATPEVALLRTFDNE